MGRMRHLYNNNAVSLSRMLRSLLRSLILPIVFAFMWSTCAWNVSFESNMIPVDTYKWYIVLVVVLYGALWHLHVMTFGEGAKNISLLLDVFSENLLAQNHRSSSFTVLLSVCSISASVSALMTTTVSSNVCFVLAKLTNIEQISYHWKWLLMTV